MKEKPFAMRSSPLRACPGCAIVIVLALLEYHLAWRFTHADGRQAKMQAAAAVAQDVVPVFP